MQALNAGDVVILTNKQDHPDYDAVLGESIDLLIVETDEKEFKGLVISDAEGWSLPNPIAVLITESRFEGVNGDELSRDQLVWILLPISVELKSVVQPCRVERIGHVTPAVMEDVQRKIAVILLSENQPDERIAWEFDIVRSATENALADLNASAQNR